MVSVHGSIVTKLCHGTFRRGQHRSDVEIYIDIGCRYMRIELWKSARIVHCIFSLFPQGSQPLLYIVAAFRQATRPSPNGSSISDHGANSVVNSLALQSHLQDMCEPTHSLRQVTRLFPRKAEAKLVSKAIRRARRFTRHLEKIATCQT